VGAGIQPSALEFLDGDTLAIVAGGYPGTVPADAGFCLIVEVDGSSAEADARRRELIAALEETAVAIEEPPSAPLWRWRDGFNGVVTAARGRKVSEDVVLPLDRLQEGLERFQEMAARQGLRSCA